MLDIKQIRENTQAIVERLNTRGQDFSFLYDVVKQDEKRRTLLQEVETLKAFRNESSKKIGLLKKQGEDASQLMAEVSKANERISEIDTELSDIEKNIQNTLAVVPNVPRETVVVGHGEEDNVEVRRNGVIPKFNFTPKAHWEIGVNLGILDFEGGAKLTGSRFTVYKGLGAKLERALINFMLDLHIEQHHYEEMLPPFMVNANSMYGTGQLPKFEEDLFKVEPFGYYLIPTAEVPVTNYHANEILSIDDLPKFYTAYTPCFRAEAGAAGKDTRGIIRQHQFNKVELVKFVKPEDSAQELENLTQNAEKVLQLLELPYRTMMLCTGDMGFSSAQTYDLEVWLPSFEGYREISSCSTFEDFQARRANIRFKRDEKAKPEFVHTLNGSGLAVGRTVAAILENYQNEDGSVTIPKVLRPYFGGLEKIEKK
ncbi:MAG: serine--tRNA ligase [Erysipelotrichia bacterium]|jgi:seryl-tRNA synthetase|nr:serine--tRNA ligase [Erysipelotrichia bacterium]